MTDLICDENLLKAFAAVTPAPILSDEQLEYLGEVYQREPDLRGLAFFDTFVNTPSRFLGGVRPIEHAPPGPEGSYRHLLPEQRRAAAIIDRPFLLEWLGR